jgi:hypothetical protein
MIYGAYAALLRRRPATHPLNFLVATMGIGSCMILPFYLGKIVLRSRMTGHQVSQAPSWRANSHPGPGAPQFR